MLISRRASLLAGALGLIGASGARAQTAPGTSGAMAATAPAAPGRPPARKPWVRSAQFVKDSEAQGLRWVNVHQGKGETGVKSFRFDRAPWPVNFVTYDFPPGASEGVHVHRLGDWVEGPFDEYYYIVSGSGQMEIDGQIVPVKAGDHVFTPLEVHHGIENTSSSENLKVFLTFIERQA